MSRIYEASTYELIISSRSEQYPASNAIPSVLHCVAACCSVLQCLSFLAYERKSWQVFIFVPGLVCSEQHAASNAISSVGTGTRMSHVRHCNIMQDTAVCHD